MRFACSTIQQKMMRAYSPIAGYHPVLRFSLRAWGWIAAGTLTEHRHDSAKAQLRVCRCLSSKDPGRHSGGSELCDQLPAALVSETRSRRADLGLACIACETWRRSIPIWGYLS
jgi:hypothetical protein